MKWIYTVIALTTLALATPVEVQLEKRASVNDVPTVGYAAAAGTVGGSGGASTTVTSSAALKTALANNNIKVVVISGNISGAGTVDVGSNTSVIGLPGSSITGIGFRVIKRTNVIIRNVKVIKVAGGDAITVEGSSKVWIDHNDLSSDLDHDKDYYDGLLDITHGSNAVTVTNNKFSNHFKTCLIGHADDNGSEDTSITVTLANNYWTNVGSRTPSFRFGRGHVFNNYYQNNDGGINTRMGAQLLAENNVWEGTSKAIETTGNGYAVARGNTFNGATNTAPTGSFTTAPYSYSLLAVGSVKSSVIANAGQKLSF